MFFVTNEIGFPRRSAVARVTIRGQNLYENAKIFHDMVHRFLILYRLKNTDSENLEMCKL
jgi:hypothetical protein